MNGPPAKVLIDDRIPLVIGVAGHVSLDPGDVPAIEAAVRRVLGSRPAGASGEVRVEAAPKEPVEVFTSLQHRYPSTPLVVLTCLAPGADRLVARVAREQGARVVAVLPLPPAEYAAVLGEDAADGGLARALAQVDATVVVPAPAGAGPLVASAFSTEEARRRLYAATNAYIVRHAQWLLAVWDGDDRRRPAGSTAEAVAFEIEGVPAQLSSVPPAVNPLDTGVVVHVWCRRAGAPAGGGEPGSIRVLFPAGWRGDAAGGPVPRAGFHGALLAGLDGYNAEVAAEPLAPAVAERARAELLGEGVGPLSPPLEHLVGRFVRANHLAGDCKARARRFRRSLYVLTFLAAVAFDVFAHVFASAGGYRDGTLGVAARVARSVPWLLLVAIAVTMWARLRARSASRPARAHDAWQKYRALAEAIRVQLFWRAAGVPDVAADHYLGKQRTQLDWIVHALRAVDLEHALVAAAGATGAAPPDLPFVARAWVSGQRAYFESALSARRAAVRRSHAAQLRLLWAAVGVAGALAAGLVARTWFPAADVVAGHGVFGAAVLAIELLVLSAALLHGYEQSCALEEESKQFLRMREMFGAAERRLVPKLAAAPGAAGPRPVQDYLRLVGVEALHESAEWVLLHCQRPIEAPHG